MAALEEDQIRALDQTRIRLLALRASLARMQESIANEQPLPSASTLQVHSNVVSSNLREIAEQLARHQQMFMATHVFPTPKFPGRYAAHILTDTLLRTKLEPNVDEWLEQGEGIETREASTNNQSEAERAEFWNWALQATFKEFNKLGPFIGKDYTLLEVQNGAENVVTGLKRELIVPEYYDEAEDAGSDEDESDGEEVEDDSNRDESRMDIEKPTQDTTSTVISSVTAPVRGLTRKPANLETFHEFMTTGQISRYEPELMDRVREAAQKKQGQSSLAS